MPDQTVEDLGKLVKTKYPKVYDNINDIELGNRVRDKYPDAYGHFIPLGAAGPVQKGPPGTGAAGPTPESTFSKLKGALYDPTIGTVGQGARDLFTPGKRLQGTHEMISGAEKALLPVGAAAAVMNPEVTIPAMALGAAGEVAGNYIPRAFGASPELSNVIGDVSGLAAGGLGAKAGPRISSAIKVAAPDIAKGGAMLGAGELLASRVPGMEWPARIAMGYPGARTIGKGLAAGGRELFKGPAVDPKEQLIRTIMDYQSQPKVEVPTQEGPKLGLLKTSLKNGSINVNQFDAEIDKMNLHPDVKALEKQNARASIQPVLSSEQTSVPSSISELEKEVFAGRMTIDKFRDELKSNLKRTDVAADRLVNQLQDKIDKMKEDEEEETKGIIDKKGKVEAPGKKTEAPKKEVAPKRPSVQDLEREVFSGRLDMDGFRTEVKKDLGLTDRAVDIKVNQLQDKIDKMKKDEEESRKVVDKPKVKSPKKSNPLGEVKAPKTYQQAVNEKAGKPIDQEPLPNPNFKDPLMQPVAPETPQTTQTPIGPVNPPGALQEMFHNIPDEVKRAELLRQSERNESPNQAVAKGMYAMGERKPESSKTFEAAGRADKSQNLAQMLHDEGTKSSDVAKWEKTEFDKERINRGFKNKFSDESRAQTLYYLRKFEGKGQAK